MRILYFADIRFPLERANGIQTMETCHALARRGHHVHLVVRPDTQRPAREPFDYYGLPPLPGLTLERAPVTGPQLARRIGYLSFAAGRALGAGRADVLMTRDLGAASLVAAVPRALRAPLVYESHGYAPDVSAELPAMLTTAKAPSRGRLKRLASREAAVWRQADGYVTITRGLADDLLSRFGPRSQLAVVPDGVRGPVEAWEPPPRWDRVAYAGHLYPWKGVDVLLQAIALAPHVTAIVVGGHPQEADRSRLESLAAALGIVDRVEFTGQVAPASVPPFLRRAGILVLPNTATAASARFTSPLKLFEYMAAGRAIVASDLPALREVLQHEANALLVPPNSPDAIAAGFARLSADPALAERLGRQALADAAEYTWDQRAARLEALFQEVASPR